MNTPQKEDILLYEEKDPSFFLDITKSKDRKYLLLNSNTKTTSEVRILDSNTLDNLKIVSLRVPNTEYFVDHIYVLLLNICILI